MATGGQGVAGRNWQIRAVSCRSRLERAERSLSKVNGGVRLRVYAAMAAIGLVAAAIASGPAAPAIAAPAAGQQGPGLFAWGGNDHGQLGDGTTTERDSPVQIPGLPAGVLQLTVSPDALFSAALLAGGTVSAWGANGFGQLGDDSTIDHHSPGTVVGLTGITQISAGGGFMLAVDASGSVWSWGLNDSGQLGNGTAGAGTNTDVPGRVAGLGGIIQVAAGDETSLALRSDGTVWAWGSNAEGQLGDHITVNRDTPEQVPGLTGITEIAETGASFALRSDGTLFAWGDNGSSELGNGTKGGFSATPAPVPGIPAVTQVSTSGLTTLAITAPNGTAWGWGDNTAGEIGDGTDTYHASPRQLALTGVVQISSGIFDGAAVLSDGTLLTWGANGTGALGIGTTSAQSASPVQVTSLIHVSQVSMSNGYGLALGESAFATVPSVHGDTTTVASSVLKAAGFVLGTVTGVTDNTCNNINRVITQNPAAGTTARLGSAVAVTIGLRPKNPCP